MDELEIFVYMAISYFVFAAMLASSLIYILKNAADRYLLWMMLKQSFPIWLGSITFGMVQYLTYARADYAGPDPNILVKKTGVYTIQGIAMTGITFLLVFRASKGMNRWWEARGHIGSIMTRSKTLVTCCLETNRSESIVTLVKLFFASLSLHLSGELPLPDFAMLVHNVEKSKEDVATAVWEQDVKLVINKSLGLDIDLGTSPCFVSSNSSRPLETPKVQALGLTMEQVEFWNGLKGAHRVLVIWRWLRKCVLESNLSNVEKQPCKADLTNLLESFYGMAKVKMHGVEKTPLSVLEAPIFYIMVIVFLPHVLAMQFFQDLQVEHLVKGYQFHPTRFLEFIAGITTIVFFFQSLRLVCDQFMDPFGKDCVDMHLFEFQQALFKELDVLAQDAKLHADHCHRMDSARTPTGRGREDDGEDGGDVVDALLEGLVEV